MLTSLALAATAAFAGPSAFAPSVPTAAGTAAVYDNVPAPTLPDAASAVSIETKDKQLLAGSFYEPKRRKGKSAAPAALLLHDAGASRDDLEEIAVYLHKKGFAVLTVDLRGHGGSATDAMSFEKSDEKGQNTLWGLATRDVDAASSFLLGKKGVHASNLSIIGVGAGAALAVRRAADDENVRSVVLIEPDPKAFGYNLAGGMADLGGLPTLVVSSKETRTVADRLQAAAHDGNGGLEYVDVTVVKSKADETLGDKRLKSSTAAWLREQVMPRK
ncbi:MAG: alpha/beta fold hydrolase [Planctomycetota bacterium]